jgi:plastocyanin
LTAGAVLTLSALAGCGASDTSRSAATDSTATALSTVPAPARPGAGWLTLAANPNDELTFNKRALVAKKPVVRIDFTNNARLRHDLTIAARNGAVIAATPPFRGGARALMISLKPGKYTYYCSVLGHRGGGMQGTLVVR